MMSMEKVSRLLTNYSGVIRLNYYQKRNFLMKKVPTVSAKLSWSHYDELLKLTDENIINYYIKISEEQNLTVKKLREKIMKK